MTAVADTAPLLEAHGLRKSFGGVHAVTDGQLVVGRREMVGLVGPNGCGKSTTLKMIAGLLQPDGGSIVFDGEPLGGDFRSVREQGILLVPQEIALPPEDTVWQSVVLGAEPRRWGAVRRQEARARARRALEMLGHELPLDAPVKSLTAVDRRILTIARGASQEHAKLLILDEPTAGLPPREADRVLEAMRSLVSQDRSIILVSHHVDDIVRSCRRVTVMRDGEYVTTLEDEAVTKDGIVDLLLSGAPSVSAVRHDGDEQATGATVGRVEDVSTGGLDGVSFTVRRGEIVGLAGLLGSGVDEALQLLTGRIRPAAGRVTVGEAEVEPKSPRMAFGNGVGFVTGDRAAVVMPTMTVGEHVALSSLRDIAVRGVVVGGRERTWVQRALDRLAVKGAAGALMTSLSGGNQQRALMSRWVAADVDLLVVDQPTVGVDMAGRAQLLSVVRQLSADCGIVLAAEPEELEAVCDRVLCFRRGRVVAELSRDEATEARILAAIA